MRNKPSKKTDDVGGPAMDATVMTNYLNAFSLAWNGAASTDAKMDLWATEYFIALTGNGIDGYNSYCRNGFPRDLQPNIETSPGNFPLSQFYPANAASTNSNVKQKTDLTGRVFWNTSGPSNLK